jgi:CubicO group peptidase (beta-lactamase class C family)
MSWKNCLLYILISLSLHTALPLCAAPPTEKSDARPAQLSDAERNVKILLDRYFMQRYRQENFNGVVLIAHNGKPIYEQTFGYSDLATKEQLTQNTPFELASISKTFTATAILKLDEQGSISIDDPVKLYFPDFPYEAITLRHLLTHRSGLPDYVFMGNYFITDRTHYMNNEDVINIFVKKKAQLLFRPNSKFEYSNSNYAILAAVVAHVTGMKFQTYIHDSIFVPLGMNHSFVFDYEDTVERDYARTHDSYGQKLKDVCFDGAVGDKGVYSTVEDMLKWDNALKSGKILSEEAVEEAYKPRSFEPESFENSNSKNYGYGWRMSKQADGTDIIYHNGWWHGNNNVFARDLKDNTTIIVLGNRLNQGNYYTEPIWNILKVLKEEVAVQKFDNPSFLL